MAHPVGVIFFVCCLLFAHCSVSCQFVFFSLLVAGHLLLVTCRARFDLPFFADVPSITNPSPRLSSRTLFMRTTVRRKAFCSCEIADRDISAKLTSPRDLRLMFGVAMVLASGQ